MRWESHLVRMSLIWLAKLNKTFAVQLAIRLAGKMEIMDGYGESIRG